MRSNTTVGAALRGRPWLIISLLIGCAIAISAQTNRSVYTPLGDKECKTIKSAEAGDEGYEARCRGTAGYTLLLSEGDLRQNITVITPQGKQHSLDLWTVISGGFSSLGPKAEWRLDKASAPVALILRYNASENPDKPEKLTSYLAVAKITPTEICVTEKISPGVTANEDARRAADASSTKSCLKNP
ncbi:MAG TPA: hypothetical protein VFX63_16980 [Pyrinomonadaceae bacterium]|nr:hypothetical protein [Pyrinomonadaceae bacterium]